MIKILLADVRGADYRKIYKNLSATRRQKAEALASEGDKLRSATAGFLLDKALRLYGLSEKDARYTYGKNGKPYLKDAGVFFNLSHSGNVAVCAVGEVEVGVDIQQMRTVDGRLADRICTDEEKKLACRREEFFRIWTAKESFIKLTGEGLATPLSSVDTLRLNACVQSRFIDDYALSVCTYFPTQITLDKVDF